MGFDVFYTWESFSLPLLYKHCVGVKTHGLITPLMMINILAHKSYFYKFFVFFALLRIGRHSRGLFIFSTEHRIVGHDPSPFFPLRTKLHKHIPALF